MPFKYNTDGSLDLYRMDGWWRLGMDVCAEVEREG
jgi:hypothetical protein